MGQDRPRLPDGNLNDGIASRLRVVYRDNNLPDHPLNQSPPVPAQNYDRDFPVFEVLLIGKVVAGGRKNLKAGGLGNPQ